MLLVRAWRYHIIISFCYGDDLRFKGNLVAAYFMRVAFAIPSFMVCQYYLRTGSEFGKLLKNLLSVLRMLCHLIPLLRVELPRLGYYAGRNADFTYIMHQCHDPKLFY